MPELRSRAGIEEAEEAAERECAAVVGGLRVCGFPLRGERVEREGVDLAWCEVAERRADFAGDLEVVGLRLPVFLPGFDDFADGAEAGAFFLWVSRCMRDCRALAAWAVLQALRWRFPRWSLQSAKYFPYFLSIGHWQDTGLLRVAWMAGFCWVVVVQQENHDDFLDRLLFWADSSAVNNAFALLTLS